MRPHPIVTLTALVLASTGAAYYFFRDNAFPRQVETVELASRSTASLNGTKAPLHDERRDSPVNPEQQRLSHLNEKIADLEARLHSLEATASEQAPDPTGSSPDTPAAHAGNAAANAKKFSEADLGQWLDAALATRDFDRAATQLTMEAMATSLAAVSGINLTELQCGGQFCRASFVSDNGKPPNMAQLMGAAPFIEAGFTLTEPDGGVRVYFTQPGQSLSELRSEARESAVGELHPQ
jgi:hypothetical protein